MDTNQKKLETEVKANAKKLDKKDLSEYKDGYVVFDGTTIIQEKDFGTAVRTGTRKFGKDTGFVVRAVGQTPTFSYLIKG